MSRRKALGLASLVCLSLVGVVTHGALSQETVESTTAAAPAHGQSVDYWSLLFVFALSTFIGIGVALGILAY